MKIRFIPTLKDNYSYLVIDEGRRSALLIDPAEAGPVMDELQVRNLAPQAIWVTHHHQDHTGGIPGLLARYPGTPVICSHRDRDRVPGCSDTVGEGDRLEFAGESAQVLEVPGHAEGHIAFHFPGANHLFSGDVIFGASCGAVFGDTYREMWESVSKIARLTPDTHIWCGHEYTANNLRWAEVVLGEAALAERKREHKVPSVPLLLETELATNPFFRLQAPEVQAYVGVQPDAYQTFKALRQAKDRF